MLICDAALMLLMLMGLVGCLLFWLGARQVKHMFPIDRSLPILLQARIP